MNGNAIIFMQANKQTSKQASSITLLSFRALQNIIVQLFTPHVYRGLE